MNKKIFKKSLMLLSIIATLSNVTMAATATKTIAPVTASKTQLMVGTSVKDITPQSNMFPLFRKPAVEIVGILDQIHVRVIALANSGGAPTLMICAETGRSLGPQIAEIVSKHTGIPLENIFNTSTHSHAAPELSETVDLVFEEGSKISTQQLWAKYALEQTLKAADEALANMKPAVVGYAYSESYINVNRNVEYNQIDEKGNVTKTKELLGYNPTGPSDKTLAAVEFKDLNGEPIAFIVNYSVHGTVMHANTILNGKTGVSSDIPGLAAKYLEDKYKGSVAMWLSGAAADQNPIIQNNMYTPSPKDGTYQETFSNSYDILTYLSKIHYQDIEKALTGIKEFKNVELSDNYIESYIPAKNGGDYMLSMQLVRLGDLALVGYPGELYTGTGNFIKKNSTLKNTLVVNHDWNKITQGNNYTPDDYTINTNGFGTSRAAYKTGYLDNALSKMTNTLINETNDWIFNGDGTAKNKKTGKVVILGLDGRPGTKDDNQVVSPTGKVLLKDVAVSYDNNNKPYVNIGNDFHLYAGVDAKLGTTDDVVKGFGSYAQNDTTGKTKESLNWRLLDINNGKATLSVDKIIEPVQFNLKDMDGNSWAESNLRSWLNSKGGTSVSGDKVGFYNTAFTSDEKSKISLTNIGMNSGEKFIAYNKFLEGTGAASNWELYSTKGLDTQDYVYVMSAEEVFKYFGKSKIATQKELGHDPANYTNAMAFPTKYAVAKGVKINEGGNGASYTGYGDSWTRSPGVPTDGKAYYGVFLGSVGSLNSGRPVTRGYGALPVITVDLKK